MGCLGEMVENEGCQPEGAGSYVNVAFSARSIPVIVGQAVPDDGLKADQHPQISQMAQIGFGEFFDGLLNDTRRVLERCERF